MKSINYKIEFFTYWHVGSGISGGTYADNLVLKDQNSLPYVPGRTLKGLFREASEQLNRLDPNRVGVNEIEKIFGKRKGAGLEDESISFFKDAVISRELAKKIINEKSQDMLFEVISSTKLNKDGLAEDGSLRQLEVCVPLGLYGSVEVFEDMDLGVFSKSAAWIKSLGLNRNRGLGKCKLSIL